MLGLDLLRPSLYSENNTALYNLCRDVVVWVFGLLKYIFFTTREHLANWRTAGQFPSKVLLCTARNSRFGLGSSCVCFAVTDSEPPEGGCQSGPWLITEQCNGGHTLSSALYLSKHRKVNKKSVFSSWHITGYINSLFFFLVQSTTWYPIRRLHGQSSV